MIPWRGPGDVLAEAKILIRARKFYARAPQGTGQLNPEDSSRAMTATHRRTQKGVNGAPAGTRTKNGQESNKNNIAQRDRKTDQGDRN